MTRGYLTDRRGIAAVEFALWLGLLTVPLLNAIDLGFYAYQSIQVREAAEVAAQAAEALCSPGSLVPAAPNCTAAAAAPGLSAELTNAAQTTSLATKVTVVTSGTGASSEGWYCSNTTGGLTLVGSTWSVTATSATAQPACSGTVSKNPNNASDYITVNVTYTFKPLFSIVSVASLLNTSITQSATMRLG